MNRTGNGNTRGGTVRTNSFTGLDVARFLDAFEREQDQPKPWPVRLREWMTRVVAVVRFA